MDMPSVRSVSLSRHGVVGIGWLGASEVEPDAPAPAEVEVGVSPSLARFASMLSGGGLLMLEMQ